MSGRGSAGTLRRLGPKVARRGRPPRYCHVTSQGLYLRTIHPDREVGWTVDPIQALRLTTEVGRQVALGLIELGESAELVPVGKGGGRG